MDELGTAVGSTNFDSCWFSINDVANLNLHNAGFARDHSTIFDCRFKQVAPGDPQAKEEPALERQAP